MLASPTLAAPDYLAVGAKTTTWRVGDFIIYRASCHSAEVMLEIARKRSDELFTAEVEKGRCSYLIQQFPAVLVRWVDGPFIDPSGNWAGSVWEIKDLEDDTEFFWLQDSTGAHKPVKARGA